MKKWRPLSKAPFLVVWSTISGNIISANIYSENIQGNWVLDTYDIQMTGTQSTLQLETYLQSQSWNES